MEFVKIKVEYSMEDFVRALTYTNNRSWLYRHSTVVIVASVFAVMLLMIAALQDPSGNAGFLGAWLIALVPALFAGGSI